MKRVFFNNKGFSLLEVMIALAIIAIALVSLLGLSNRSILIQDRIQKLSRATLLAQQVMSELELKVVDSSSIGIEQEEVFEEPFSEFRWRIDYEATPIATVRQVTVTVLWGKPEHNEQVQLVSFMPVGGL